MGSPTIPPISSLPAEPTYVTSTKVLLPTPNQIEANETPISPATKRKLPLEPRPYYQLEASLDYSRHFLEVRAWITYPNRTSRDLENLIMVVEANRYPGVFVLKSLHGLDGERWSNFRLRDTTLNVILPQPLTAGETIAFKVEYTLQLKNTRQQVQIRPYPLGYNELQANFGDWYPFIPVYQEDEGWMTHPPALFGEHLVYEIADYEVSIRQVGAQTGLTIIASAPGEEDGDWIRFSHLAGRNFAWSASPYYHSLSQTVNLSERHSVEVVSVFFPFHEKAGRSLLVTTSQALKIFSELFGDYPHPQLSAVQAEFLDGMEYDGLYFLSTDFYNWHKDTPEDFLTALGAHETAHQWWMALVGNDPAREPWLDEAFSTYSERLYYENAAPEALEWWWTWRVNYYEPKGWVNLQINEIDQAVGQWRAYRDPVYLNGAIFLEELRTFVGDDAFFAALLTYADRNAYRQANAAGFWEAFQEHSARDLAPIKIRYFRSPP